MGGISLFAAAAAAADGGEKSSCGFGTIEGDGSASFGASAVL